MKGLSEGLGTLSGDVRLEIETDLQIVPSAYVRAADGTLGARQSLGLIRGPGPKASPESSMAVSAT